MITIEHPAATVRCRAAIKTMFHCFDLCRSVKLDSISWSFALVEQELLTLPGHMILHPVFSGVHVAR
jgi:hypothetical protein